MGGELAVRSIAALLPFVAGDWRVDEKLYMSFEPSCLGNGVEREGELAGEAFERLVVGDAVCCRPCPASTEGSVCCLSGEACCCCCARLRLRLSGGEVGVCCLTLDRRDADGMCVGMAEPGSCPVKDAAVVECSGNGTELRLAVVITYRRRVRVKMTTATKVAVTAAKVVVSRRLVAAQHFHSLLPLWPIETQNRLKRHTLSNRL